MSNSSRSASDGVVGPALFRALMTALIATLVIKMITGLTFTPLAVIAIVTLVSTFGMTVRLKRQPRPR